MTSFGQFVSEVQIWGVIMALGLVSIAGALWWPVLNRRPAPAPPSNPAECLCGHGQFVHEHYRAGTDCGLCPCQIFTPRRDTPAGHTS